MFAVFAVGAPVGRLSASHAGRGRALLTRRAPSAVFPTCNIQSTGPRICRLISQPAARPITPASPEELPSFIVREDSHGGWGRRLGAKQKKGLSRQPKCEGDRQSQVSVVLGGFEPLQGGRQKLVRQVIKDGGVGECGRVQGRHTYLTHAHANAEGNQFGCREERGVRVPALVSRPPRRGLGLAHRTERSA
jgi:hypothetical protein